MPQPPMSYLGRILCAADDRGAGEKQRTGYSHGVAAAVAGLVHDDERRTYRANFTFSFTRGSRDRCRVVPSIRNALARCRIQ